MIYLASPWFDEEAKSFCEEVEEFIISESREAYFPRRNQFDSALETFYSNVNNISNCDLLVALVLRKDVGTAWEIGMAYSKDIPIILVGKDENTFNSKTNLMLAMCGTCMTFDEFKKYLTNEKLFNVIKFDNWEGIE